MNKTALIVIDMQNGLLQRKVHNKQGLISNINDLLTMFHYDNFQILLSIKY